MLKNKKYKLNLSTCSTANKLQFNSKIPTIEKLLLTKNSLEENLLGYYYKNDKKPKNQLLLKLRNFNKKPYWKIRKSRILFWKLFSYQTLKKQKYLAKKDNLYKEKFKTESNALIVLRILYNIYISDLRISSEFYKNFKLLITLKTFSKESVLYLPVFYKNLINWSLLKKKNFKKIKKVGKWSYLKYKKFIKPWLQHKKNFPKITYKIIPKFRHLKKYFSYDLNLGIIYIFSNFSCNELSYSERYKNNRMQKLHIFRYKPKGTEFN